MNFTRRDLMKANCASIAGIGIAPKLARRLISSPNSNSVCVFTKCLQFLDYEELGEIIARSGFYGADLTVRDGLLK